ncbi:unnamed protein product [Microthlaspi erraticum]|uniref:Uncharacterized protein n=1 Tax=Microthlaspi erraticum TaxID=1685480 RepID=A0A6D2K3Y8_9BRAS|nr:unnamed protein product [Microthlaspi erraticum]
MSVLNPCLCVLDNVCLKLNSCYTRFPHLLQIQLLSSLIFEITFMIASKIGLKLQGLILAVVIIIPQCIIISHYYSKRLHGPRQQQHHCSRPIRRLVIQWQLHLIIECLAKEIELQSEWADWFLICSFFAFYCHIITFAKIMGYLQDVGAADALLSLGVLLSSKVLQGPNLRFLASVIIIMVVMLREHRAAFKEEEERKST